MTAYSGTVALVDTEQFGDPNDPMNAHNLRFEDGTEATLYLPAKVPGPKVGDSLDGDIFPGKGGKQKFKRKPRNTQPSQVGGAAQAVVSSTGSARPDERENRIVRQHSQEMALRYAAHAGTFDGLDVANLRADPRTTPPDFLRGLIDWFQADAMGLEEESRQSAPSGPVSDEDDIPFARPEYPGFFDERERRSNRG